MILYQFSFWGSVFIWLLRGNINNRKKSILLVPDNVHFLGRKHFLLVLDLTLSYFFKLYLCSEISCILHLWEKVLIFQIVGSKFKNFNLEFRIYGILVFTLVPWNVNLNMGFEIWTYPVRVNSVLCYRLLSLYLLACLVNVLVCFLF